MSIRFPEIPGTTRAPGTSLSSRGIFPTSPGVPQIPTTPNSYSALLHPHKSEAKGKHPLSFSSSMTKRLTPQEKKARRPTSRACVFCHSKHLQCSHSRPCQNCIKRNLAHECRDVVRKRAKYMSTTEVPAVSGESSSESGRATGENGSEMGNPPDPQIAYLDGVFERSSIHESLQDSPMSTPASNFNSNFLNQEYMMLGDLISKPSSPSLDVPMMYAENPSRPFISLGQSDERPKSPELNNFDFSSLDKAQYVSPLVSHHIYQNVQDIYANKVIDFDYPSSYHSLTSFLRQRFSFTGKSLSDSEKAKKRENLLMILRLIASYRPTFISTHKALFRPFDFQFLEMSFQRCLLDYENLSRLNASPTIIWRRTGEIVSMSNDLVALLGLNISTILSKRTFILELMYDDESIVEYFRLFESVAVGNLHSTIVTRCKLIKRPSEGIETNTSMDSDYIEFCSVWTVKRDLFDLPMMVVGQFLPVLPTPDGFRTY
ncbi:putative glucose starvation modulator [Clavispora lusitaniae]|uniref:Glucose starvation modulator n=1 Tax=Clavispora lusitaniae TaxID=36911 RepID=A0ACD0WHK2_CLALS|nr:putative zinc cluster protein of unknown function [Clavispora lusitaniae]QFZ27059.1 putative glucose starvation modulator [Clavispora lusitaniae]QFZ33633.1 putative glucose starvation modulator [Clavispora lusitaniae]QFZ39304.1 putative glucose starvation modulator [Clavispora lusitaniae]QFZ44986.1 putative glucose starvation modulator [Clavispora lusitaniae]